MTKEKARKDQTLSERIGPVSRFEVSVCCMHQYTKSLPSRFFDTEIEALEWAEKHVSPTYAQVTITAHAENERSFAIRHLTYSANGVKDCHWRCWVAEEFTGGVKGAETKEQGKKKPC